MLYLRNGILKGTKLIIHYFYTKFNHHIQNTT